MRKTNKILYTKCKFCLHATFIISVFIIFTACNKKEIKSNAREIIKFQKNRNGEFTIKNYVDSTVYVKLQTFSDCVIRRINRIKIFDNKIFIHDSKLESLFVFDMSGMFLYKIHRVGMGPEEYSSFTSFCIDQHKKMVLIHDLSKNSIYKYCSDNGEFRGVIRIKDGKSFARDISVLDNGDFLCYSYEYPDDAYCGIWVLDSKGEFKTNLWKQTKEYPVIPIDPNPILIKRLKNSLYSVFDVVNNIIYHYDGVNLIKAYQFDFSEIPVTSVSDYPGVTNMKRFEAKTKNVIEISAIQETNNYIWTSWVCNQIGTQTFYIKNKRKLIRAEKTNLIDGILGNMKPTDNEDIICFEIRAWECNGILKDDKNSEIGVRIKPLMEKTKPDDNPILQIYYMKR